MSDYKSMPSKGHIEGVLMPQTTFDDLNVYVKGLEKENDGLRAALEHAGFKCEKCGGVKNGRGITFATESTPEECYLFCANWKSGCYWGW